MNEWTLQDTPAGLRLAVRNRRALGSPTFTWAHLVYGHLGSVKVFVVYFPSRFDLEVDKRTIDAIRSFGSNTGPDTSVNVWDPTDPAFSTALALFDLHIDLHIPPALVFASGLGVAGIEPYGPDTANLYAIAITDRDVLGDRERLASAANTVHEIILRSNPKEIAAYVRKQDVAALLSTIASIAGHLRDELLKFKPSIKVPGGVGVQIG